MYAIAREHGASTCRHRRYIFISRGRTFPKRVHGCITISVRPRAVCAVPVRLYILRERARRLLSSLRLQFLAAHGLEEALRRQRWHVCPAHRRARSGLSTCASSSSFIAASQIPSTSRCEGRKPSTRAWRCTERSQPPSLRRRYAGVDASRPRRWKARFADRSSSRGNVGSHVALSFPRRRIVFAAILRRSISRFGGGGRGSPIRASRGKRIGIEECGERGCFAQRPAVMVVVRHGYLS